MERTAQEVLGEYKVIQQGLRTARVKGSGEKQLPVVAVARVEILSGRAQNLDLPL